MVSNISIAVKPFLGINFIYFEDVKIVDGTFQGNT